jgi:hypothetical protein
MSESSALLTASTSELFTTDRLERQKQTPLIEETIRNLDRLVSWSTD